MNALLGFLLGVAMIVGGALVFRHAEGLVGARTRAAATSVGGPADDGLELKIALNRAVALGTAVLGVATILVSLP